VLAGAPPMRLIEHKLRSHHWIKLKNFIRNFTKSRTTMDYSTGSVRVWDGFGFRNSWTRWALILILWWCFPKISDKNSCNKKNSNRFLNNSIIRQIHSKPKYDTLKTLWNALKAKK
jgi:hypothetical protein